MGAHCYCLREEGVLHCILHKIATYVLRLQAKQRRSSCITLRKAKCSRFQCTQIPLGSSGLTLWKIRSMIHEVECASLCNKSSHDDCSCLKFRLTDAKVHQVILHRSKICGSKLKRVLKGWRDVTEAKEKLQLQQIDILVTNLYCKERNPTLHILR